MQAGVQLEGDRDKLFKLGDNVSSAVQLILVDVGLMIQNRAKQNAPVRRREQYPNTPSNQKRRGGTLRKSIGADFDFIQKGVVIVGSDVKYARVREYVNNLNPHTRRYLRRGYSENKSEIKKIISEDLSKELK